MQPIRRTRSLVASQCRCGAPTQEPLTGVALAVHAVVFVEVHESVEALPEKMLAGAAFKVTDGVPGGVAKQIEPFQEEPLAQEALAVA